MSRMIVELEEKEREATTAPLEAYDPPSTARRVLKLFGFFIAVLIVVALVAGVAGIIYWRNLQGKPQYSLALLIEAARNGDQATIDQIVDTDAVVEDFVPQVTEKAVELYGRGLPPKLVAQASKVAAPILPVVKERARAEFPKLLRERTRQFENVPFFLMAAGAERYLEIRIEGTRAIVSSKLKDRPLEIEMEKNGDRWKIVAVKDEALAKKIAQKIGQQIIAIVKGRGAETIDRVGREIGLKDLGDLLKTAEDLLQ